ncbi:DUF2690 domain-containing protein [Micromonospora sp. NPDC049891]|uniref:DUF2690 domain-containing protein n=1 Tax=Micromonospora sp. NPDC049891 TaxID=3155655 RepID=UPI0033D14BC7
MQKLSSRRAFGNLLAGVMMALAAILAVPAAAAAEPAKNAAESIDETCRNNGGGGYVSCNGKDPVAMNCTGNSTKATVKAKNGVQIELRYSSSCQAYWTRYINTPGATGEARIKGTNMVQTKTLAAYKGEEGWTRMLSAAQNPKACLFFWYAPFSEYMESCA